MCCGLVEPFLSACISIRPPKVICGGLNAPPQTPLVALQAMQICFSPSHIRFVLFLLLRFCLSLRSIAVRSCGKPDKVTGETPVDDCH